MISNPVASVLFSIIALFKLMNYIAITKTL